MRNQELLKYIEENEIIDPECVRKMGFHALADMAIAGNVDKMFLKHLIELAGDPENGKKAGVDIFDKCCPDEKLRKHVHDYAKDN